jgi:hypothetical protein
MGLNSWLDAVPKCLQTRPVGTIPIVASLRDIWQQALVMRFGQWSLPDSETSDRSNGQMRSNGQLFS